LGIYQSEAAPHCAHQARGHVKTEPFSIGSCRLSAAAAASEDPELLIPSNPRALVCHPHLDPASDLSRPKLDRCSGGIFAGVDEQVLDDLGEASGMTMGDCPGELNVEDHPASTGNLYDRLQYGGN
jgi:hypothetical protein